MSTRTLLKANLKQHKGTMAGIFIIMLLVSLTMVSVLTIWLNTNTYLHEEMQRMQSCICRRCIPLCDPFEFW